MRDNGKNFIVLLVGIIIILTILCVLFASKTINFNSKNNTNNGAVVEENNNNADQELSQDEPSNNNIKNENNYSNTTVDSYLGKWYLENSDYSFINIKKNDNNSGYKVDILVNKMAEYSNLDLSCANNSGACYIYADANHSYSIMMAHNTIFVVPSERAASVATYWIFSDKK